MPVKMNLVPSHRHPRYDVTFLPEGAPNHTAGAFSMEPNTENIDGVQSVYLMRQKDGSGSVNCNWHLSLADLHDLYDMLANMIALEEKA